MSVMHAKAGSGGPGWLVGGHARCAEREGTPIADCGNVENRQSPRGLVAGGQGGCKGGCVAQNDALLMCSAVQCSTLCVRGCWVCGCAGGVGI